MSFSKSDAEPRFFAHRGFWGGVALATPVYAEFVPWVWTMFVVVPLLVIILTQRERIGWPHASIAPMIAIFFLHLMALWLSKTDFQKTLIKDLIIAGSSLCVNYKNLGLGWLIAILGCIKFRRLMLIRVSVAAGALVGSRR